MPAVQTAAGRFAPTDVGRRRNGRAVERGRRVVGDALIMEYHYEASLLDALSAHGIRPRTSTSPELVHEFISDLYRFELRRLRGRLVAGEFPKNAYFGHVVALRRRYPLVSLKPRQLAAPASASAAAR